MKKRVLAAALTLSAAGLIGIAQYEGFTDKAIIPTKNDVPTIGFGSTYYPDGSRVKLGDRITPQRALVVMKAHIDKDEEAFRESLKGVYLHQEEFDLYLDWVYQYGIAAWKKSSMLRNLKAGNYKAACDSLLLYKYSGGYDCSIPGNKICSGVWKRQLERHAKCLEAL